MKQGVTEKPATSSSFSEQVKNTLGNFFPFTMGTVTGDEAENQEKEENDDEKDDFESQISLNSSTREQVKNTLGNFFPLTMGTGTGDKAETQEEEEDNDEKDDFESQTRLNSSTQENDTYTNRETGSTEQFVVVRKKSKTTNESNQSGDFVTLANLEVQPRKNRNAGPCNPPADPEAHYEETSRQRSRTRVSTSTKLTGTD